MTSPDSIQHDIQQSLPCEFIQVNGADGVHFDAIIVSSDFEGKSRIQRHQMVFKTLGNRMQQDIHALSVKTLTPAEWEKQSCKN